MATDPVSLSYLLKAVGPVTLPSGPPLTADTAVKRLLSDSYAEFPEPEQQDAFFAGAARAVFDALISQKKDPKETFGALARSIAERRLLVWSAKPEEQAVIAGSVIDGVLPAEDGTHPTVGVFLNDGSGSKLSYYLTHSAQLAVGQCLEDGAVELKLKVELGSTAPDKGLPNYVVGMGLSGDPYTVRTNVMVYSPAGGSLVQTTVDGQETETGTGVDGERLVGVITVDLPPGKTKTIEVTLASAPLSGASGSIVPVMRTTPGVRPWPIVLTRGNGCGN
jgi:hypothetical protein